MSNKTNQQALKYKFDISAYRLLGRELITDRITALFELVKNCYDANAQNVTLEFISVNPKTKESKIIITDDGLGMSFEDIRDKWMVIGTSSKRKNKTSPAPYFRKVVGKKGVGRFAVDKLGAKLVLKTKKKEANQITYLETDWSKYSDLETEQLGLDYSNEKEHQYFTDIENKYWFEDKNDKTQGTILELTLVNDVWTENDIIRAYKELSKLISPNFKSQYPFNIKIKSQYEAYKNKKIESIAIQFATEKIHLSFDKEKGIQEIIRSENEELKIINVPVRSCGFVKFTLYYFNQSAKVKYKKYYGNSIDGIKIYRDGLIATPFAEHEAIQNKQKDILGIDKRRYSGFFDKISTRDILGYVEITDENNSAIIEATNRQSFVHNKAWIALNAFVIEQISQLEINLKKQKNLSRKVNQTKLNEASEEIKSFQKEIAKAEEIAINPELKRILKKIEITRSKLQATVNKGIKDYQKLEIESKQRESLFFSLVSLQTYASMLAHMVRQVLGIVIRDAEYLKDEFPNPKLNNRFKLIAKRIYSEMFKLGSGVDFMLKYAKTDSNFIEIDLQELISTLFFDIYAPTFEEEQINVNIEIGKGLIIYYNQKAFEDIFDNLISNSIKALKTQSNKLIKVSTSVESEKLIIYFSDNGVGVAEEDKYRIFDIFVTNTREQGGVGIGLHIVKTRIEAMQGSIELIENELKPTGATFKIELPFK